MEATSHPAECPACKSTDKHTTLLHTCGRYNTYPAMQMAVLKSEQDLKTLQEKVFIWALQHPEDTKFAETFGIKITNENMQG